MKIFTIGYERKSAKDFFDLINANDIEILLDIRLHNATKFAGFAKRQDLEYLLK